MHMSRHDSPSTVHASRYEDRLHDPRAESLAVALAVPVMAVVLLSPAGPALLMSLAALALVAVAL